MKTICYKHGIPIPVRLRWGWKVSPPRKWLGLEIKRHEQPEPGRALVEFVARYKVAGRACRLHEVSRFVREVEKWLYVDGDIRNAK